MTILARARQAFRGGPYSHVTLSRRLRIGNDATEAVIAYLARHREIVTADGWTWRLRTRSGLPRWYQQRTPEVLRMRYRRAVSARI